MKPAFTYTVDSQAFRYSNTETKEHNPISCFFCVNKF